MCILSFWIEDEEHTPSGIGMRIRKEIIEYVHTHLGMYRNSPRVAILLTQASFQVSIERNFKQFFYYIHIVNFYLQNPK
jgi:hypothetical protein